MGKHFAGDYFINVKDYRIVRKVKERFVRKHFANIVVNGSPPTVPPASEAEPPSNRCQFSSKRKQNIFHECPQSPLFGDIPPILFLVFSLYASVFVFLVLSKAFLHTNFVKYITGGKQKIGPIYKMAALPSV